MTTYQIVVETDDTDEVVLEAIARGLVKMLHRPVRIDRINGTRVVPIIDNVIRIEP